MDKKWTLFMNEKKSFKLVALTIDELVIVLKKTGSSTVTVEKIQEDITAGAPVNDDGTINYLKYVGWMLKN
ncbi:MAG: hypothetical protein KOO69_03385 [Victivallales bacterium]|nr:hypothetical protein [Victivallales bacterium]